MLKNRFDSTVKCGQRTEIVISDSFWNIARQTRRKKQKTKKSPHEQNFEMQTFTPPSRRIEFESFNEFHWMSLSDVFFHKFQFPRTLKNCCGCCLQYLTSVIEYSWHRLNVFLTLNVKWMWYKFQGKNVIPAFAISCMLCVLWVFFTLDIYPATGPIYCSMKTMHFQIAYISSKRFYFAIFSLIATVTDWLNCWWDITRLLLRCTVHSHTLYHTHTHQKTLNKPIKYFDIISIMHQKARWFSWSGVQCTV